MITINQPYSFSGLGRKANQEDSIFPLHPADDNQVFILCDGMGGHERGEVASRIVADTLGQTLTRDISERQPINADRFNKALDAAYDALDSIDIPDSDSKPGTTLTCLCLNSSSCIAAHIGDSRIYHIRPSLCSEQSRPDAAIIYRSEDHSLVNDLVRIGQITPEEARTHPRRNVITRALQPGLKRRFPATIHSTTDVQSGDYFFLCSDGILEQLSERTLCAILASDLTDAEKTDAIKAECDRGTYDNYTAILIPIKTGATGTKATRSSSYRLPLIILSLICLIAACGILSYYMGWLAPKQQSADPVAPDSTAILSADTALIDTIVIAGADTIPPAATPAADTIPAKVAEKKDTVISHPAPIRPASDTARTPNPAPQDPSSVAPVNEPQTAPPTPAKKSEEQNAVPKKPSKTDDTKVPPRVKPNTDPKPLA